MPAVGAGAAHPRRRGGLGANWRGCHADSLAAHAVRAQRRRGWRTRALAGGGDGDEITVRCVKRSSDQGLVNSCPFGVGDLVVIRRTDYRLCTSRGNSSSTGTAGSSKISAPRLAARTRPETEAPRKPPRQGTLLDRDVDGCAWRQIM